MPILLLWFAVQTQWHRGGMEGRRSGLDYPGVLAVMEVRGFKGPERAAAFELLQSMETAALEAWADLAEQKARTQR